MSNTVDAIEIRSDVRTLCNFLLKVRYVSIGELLFSCALASFVIFIHLKQKRKKKIA